LTATLFNSDIHVPLTADITNTSTINNTKAQGTTDTSNAQHFASQTTYVPSHYHLCPNPNKHVPNSIHPNTSFTKAMKKFLVDCGPVPTQIRTDFDHKLMGGKISRILTDQNIKVESAPPYRQYQNGLVE
jgi:hypothetical protein